MDKGWIVNIFDTKSDFAAILKINYELSAIVFIYIVLLLCCFILFWMESLFLFEMIMSIRISMFIKHDKIQNYAKISLL